MAISAGRRRGPALAVAGILLLAGAAGLWGLTRASVPPPDLADARRALEAGRWDEVELRLGRWSDAHPEDGEAATLLGIARLSAGRPDAAVAALDRVPEASPAWGQAQALLGEAALRRHDLPAAEVRLRKAVGRDPAAEPPRQRLIYLLSLQQRHGEARAQLWDRFRATRDPRVLLDLVERLWAHDDDVRGLVPEVAEALDVTPDDPFLRRARGLALLYDGKPAEALPHLQAAARGLENDPAGRFALAECELSLGRFSGDLDALGPRPDDPAGAARWHVLRSRLAEALNKPDEALKDLRAAVAAAPNDREAHFRLGHLLARRGDIADSRAALDRAEAIEARRLAARQEHERVRRDGFSPDPDLYERLGRLCLDAGLINEATAWSDLARTLDPGRKPLRDALAGTTAPTLEFLPVPRLRAAVGAVAATVVGPERKTIRFEDVTERAGITYRYDSGASASHFLADTIGGGVSLFDYDGDGFLDIYFVNGCPLPVDPEHPTSPNRLYRNKGDFTFEDVTERAGVGGRGYGMGFASGDYDGDGDPDLLVTGVTATLLYRNNGDGTFTDVSAEAGIASDRWTTAAAFADLDADGDPDLVVTGYVLEDFHEERNCRDAAGRRIHCSPRSYPAAPDHLFRNNGDGTFTDVAAESGFDAPEGRGLGLAVADLDGDGLLDIYVANDATDDFFFRNLGGLKFEEVAHSAGLATDGEGRATASMGTVAGDLDGDGLTDLLHTNLLNESATLHRNAGGGLFRDATLDAGLRAATRARTGFGVAAFDADRDGLLDLLIANGHVDDQPWLNSPMAQTPQFFFGEEGGRFVLSGTEGSPYLSRLVVGRGLSAGDLDNDGRVDAVLVHRDVPAVVLRNVTEGGRWVGVRLVGESAGAAVTCEAGGRKYVREVAVGSGYLGPNDSRLVFGLGEFDRVDRLEVRWPSGRIGRLGRPKAGVYHDFSEKSAGAMNASNSVPSD